MNTKFINIIIVLLSTIAFYSCDTTVDNIVVQTPYKYSDQYYKDLRDYKKTNHQISFMWFSDFGAPQSSMGLRFSGLPDSLDICSLWGGIPSDIKDKPNTFYDPLVHSEMRFCQKVKGMKMTYVTFPGINNFKEIMELPESERVKAFGDHLLKIVYDNDLDGMDLDYEISGDWMHGTNFVKLIEYLGQFIGPKGNDKSKLLIVDGWPIDGGYEYLSYFISQAYQCPNAADLQRRFNEVYVHGLNPERFIVTENIGDYHVNGGVPFTEVDGNNKSGLGGQMYSLEGMARWNPTQGKKAGFGAFYAQRDYAQMPPYKWFRYSIQIQTPSVK